MTRKEVLMELSQHFCLIAAKGRSQCSMRFTVEPCFVTKVTMLEPCVSQHDVLMCTSIVSSSTSLLRYLSKNHVQLSLHVCNRHATMAGFCLYCWQPASMLCSFAVVVCVNAKAQLKAVYMTLPHAFDNVCLAETSRRSCMFKATISMRTAANATMES